MKNYHLVMFGFVAFMSVTAASCWAWPQYNVYQATQSGHARLREAESSRRIAVLEARAKMDSAKDLAAAEVARAAGVAQANKIIGDSLRGNEAYLRYLWITGLQENQREVIYIPTEANLPVLEATRLTQKPEARNGSEE